MPPVKRGIKLIDRDPQDVLMGSCDLEKFLWANTDDFKLPEFLRNLYDNVTFGPDNWAQEREARLAVAMELKASGVFKEIEAGWNDRTMRERAGIIHNITRLLSKRAGIHPLKYICPTNVESWERKHEQIAYRAGSGYAEIFDLDGECLLNDFKTALESAIYIAVKHYQYNKAMDVQQFARGTEDYKTARLYAFEFLTPWVAQSFPWAPDELDRWLGQPGMRHALDAVQETVGFLMDDGGYEISESMKDALENEFHDKWQEMLFESDVSHREHLAYCERYINAAPDDALTRIDEIDRRNLIHVLEKIDDCDEALCDRTDPLKVKLYETADDLTAFTLFCSESLDTVMTLAKTFNQQAMAMMNPKDRVNMFNALTVAGEPEHEHEEEARMLALSFMRASPYPADMEREENDLLVDLRKKIDADPDISAARKKWVSLSIEEKIETMEKVIVHHAGIFGYKPAEEIVTYNLSRKDYEEMAEEKGRKAKVYPLMGAFCYPQSASYTYTIGRGPCRDPYPDLRRTKDTSIAINIHPDALGTYCDDYAAFEGYIIHEQTHINDYQDRDKCENGDMERADLRYGLIKTLFAEDDLRNMGHDVLAYAFYRVEMVERHAFALQEKMKSLIRSGCIKDEREIFEQALIERVFGASGPDVPGVA